MRMFKKRRAWWGLAAGAALALAAPMVPALGEDSAPVSGCSPTHALDVTVSVGEESSPHTYLHVEPGKLLADLGHCL